MANVAGTSAQTVSDQMTAVWNNFYDGSKSLEYYSDVMVKLGAATASSTDEISEGVNKFAATAKTVGLSYEYATAALATVTARTRESADTVGNAFKTLFSRIQGLNLGETLDDGTTLNKYSKALAAVGIDIKDQSGELKEMDTILDEMGSKWGTLAEAEKMALAQTVGGARQYTQLMALLENWDYFKENLDVAYNSEGALEEQQQIYAESWDAAADRVQASIEGVYQAILDDDFFIKLNNGFANALGGLEAFIEGAGGVKTIITGIGSVILGVFANKIPDALQTVRYNFDLLTKGSEAAYDRIQKQMKEASDKAFAQYSAATGGTGGIDANSSTGLEVQYANDLLAAKNKLALVSDKMSTAEEQQYKVQLSLIEAHQKETVALREQTEELERNIEAQREEILLDQQKVYEPDYDKMSEVSTRMGSQQQFYQNAAKNTKGKVSKKNTAIADEYKAADSQYDDAIEALSRFADSLNAQYERINTIIVEGIASGNKVDIKSNQLFNADTLQHLSELHTALDNISNFNNVSDNDRLAMIKASIEGLSNSIPKAVQEATGLKTILDKLGRTNNFDEIKEGFNELNDAINNAKIESKDYEKVLKAFRDNKDVNALVNSVKNLDDKTKKLEENKIGIENLMKSFQPTHVVSTTEAITTMASALGSITTIGNSFSSMIKSWLNPDLSGWERISTTFTALPTIVATGINAIKNLGTAFEFADSKLTAHLALETLLKTNMTDVVEVIGKKNSAELISIALREKSNGKTKEAVAVQLAEKLAKEQGIEVDTAKAISQNLVNVAYDTGKASLGEYTAMAVASFIQEKILNGERAKSIVLQAILNALVGEFGGTIGKILLILGGGLFIGAITGLIKLIDWLVVTQKEATEAISEANTAYNEEKTKVDELKSSLESLQKQIEELENKDTLTLTEEEELQKLHEEEASLKRQLALREQLANAKQHEAAQTFEDNFKKSSKWVNNTPDTKTNIFMQGKLTPQEYFEKYVKPTRELYDEDPNNNKIAEKLANYEQKYQEMLDKEAQARADYIEKYKDDYDELVEGYKNWLEQNPDADPTDKATYAEKIQQANKNFYGEDKWQEVAYGSVSSIKSDAEKQAGTTFSSWIDKAYMSGEELAAAGSQLAATFSDQFANELYANGIIPDQYAQWLIDQQQAKIERVAGKLGEDGAEQLKKAMEDDRWTDTSLDILDQIDLGEIDVSNLDELFNAITNFYNTEVVQDLRADLESLITTTSELSIGDILSEEDYQLLVKYNEELEKYFIYTGKGYKYLGGADSLINGLGIDEYINGMTQKRNMYDYFSTYWGNSGKTGNSDWSSYGKDNKYGVGTLANLANSDLAMAFISQLGDGSYTSEWLLALNDNLSDPTNEAAKTQATEFWNAFNSALSEGASWTDNKANELLYSQATNLTELDTTHGQVGDYEAYSKQLQALANEYDNCTQEILEYRAALGSGSSKQLKEAEQLLRASLMIGEAAEKYGLEAEEVEIQAKEMAKAYGLNSEAAAKMAINNQRMNKGLKTLNSNWKNWNKVLKKSDKTSIDYAETVSDLTDAIGDLINASEDFEIPDGFLDSADNLALIEKAAEGDKTAIEMLGTAISAAQVKAMEMDTSFTSLFDEAFSLDDFNNYKQTVLEGITNLQNAIANGTVAAGDSINSILDSTGQSWVEGLNAMAMATGMSVETMNGLLNQLGVQAKVDVVDVPQTMSVPTYTEYSTSAMTSGPVYDSNGLMMYPSSWRRMTWTVPGPSKEVEGYAQVAQISTVDGGVGAPQITYTGHGSPSKSSISSGGGGGGSSTPSHAEKKSDSEKERYHTLINQLEDLNAEYDDISKAKDRAFGKDKLKNIDAEIAKTEELIDKQEEYLDAIAADLPVDKAVMDAYYQDVIGGPAIEYDENGNIANYDAIQDAMFAKYNAMADAYDEDSEEWQVFEKKYEQLEKYIEQYEETYDLLREQEQEYQDLLNQRIDLQLEKVQYTVELKLNVSEDQVKLIEYQLGKVEDDGFKALETIGLLTNKAGELNSQIEANKQGLNDALGLSLSAAEISEVMAGNMDVLNGKNFTEDQIEAIKEYRDSLLDLSEQFDEIREQVEEQLMAAFDAWQEKLEKGIDTIDHYGSVLESYKNIIDIVGTDTLGLSDEFMNNLSQGSVDNAINKLEAANAAYKAVESSRAEAEKMLAEARAAGDTKSAEMWEETLEDLTEKSQEAQEDMLSAWEDALSKVAEQFEQSVERIVDNFNKSVYKLGGLEGLSNDFAKQQEEADMMLDDYQKIYELSKLSRDINKSIDDTDLIGGKQKLKKLLSEVNALQEDGVEMSQYDLEYLQKTYDLRLAELELEEAQRAKNTVRLSKDNEGNWSYVYTQNTDAVDAAQQKYEDALYAMQDLSSNYIDEMSEKLIETSQEMAEALAELRVEDFASIDEYYAEVDRVQKYYQEQMDFQEEELNKAIANNKKLYDEDWTAYHEATGYKISDTENFVTSFKDSILGGLVASESDTANFTDLIKGSVDTLTNELLAAANTYYENVQNAMNAADTSIEDFGEDAAAAIDEVITKSDEGATAVEDMADRMNTAVNDVMSNIQTWQQTYGAMMDQIVEDNLEVIESINALVGALSLDDYDASVSWSFTPRSSDDEEVDTGFDTGGYTGSWGKEGKLAVLHEKELVLNANDTVNMLDALRLTQELLEMIDLQAQTAKLGFGDLVAATLKDSQKEVLEQKVEITAEFPNVTDHNEIEEALMNLTNTASQYANRK